MQKKFLCVLLSVLMVVAMLPMGVFADEEGGYTIDGIEYTIVHSTTDLYATTATGFQNLLDWHVDEAKSAFCTFLLNYLDQGAVIAVKTTATGTVNIGLQVKESDSSYPYATGTVTYDATNSLILLDANSCVTNLKNDSGIELTEDNFNSLYVNDSNGYSYTEIMILVPVSATTGVDTSAWSVALSGYTTSWGGWSGVDISGLTGSFTVQEVLDANSLSSVDELGGINVQIWNLDGDATDGTTVYYLVTINGETAEAGSTTIEDNGYNASTVVGIVTTALGGSYSLAADDVIVVTVSLEPITSTDDSTVKVVRTNDFIYVNEEYHALLVYRNGRRYFVTVPHTVDANGYCTVCREYIGTEETEAGTTTVDGVEYEAAYTVDVSLGSTDGWGQVDLGDTALIDALSTEGAILVITRDGVSDTVHNGSETYEKFGLVNSWWSGEWIALGTAGHTSATEEGVIDCISDDGTSVIYDGATVYSEWVSRGMNAGGTVNLISNTSNTLKITNVTVYVPVGTVSGVDVEEPAEDTDVDDEDDGTEDLTVDDSEDETPAETNPTTGAVLALVPMAIAGLAVVASKRR